MVIAQAAPPTTERATLPHEGRSPAELWAIMEEEAGPTFAGRTAAWPRSSISPATT